MPTGKELRKLLKVNDLSMEAAAEKMGVSRGTLYNYVDKAELDSDIVQSVQEKLNISFKEDEAPYISRRRDSKSAKKDYTAPLMPAKAFAGYVKSYDQIQFMDNLEQYALPPGISYLGATWAYFEIDGDSMEPTFRDSDIILCSMVNEHDWNQLRNFYTYVIITKEALYIKRVVIDEQPNLWVLISDNDSVKAFTLPVSDVVQVWTFRRHIKRDAALDKRFDMEKIRRQIGMG